MTKKMTFDLTYPMQWIAVSDHPDMVTVYYGGRQASFTVGLLRDEAGAKILTELILRKLVDREKPPDG